MGSSTNPFGWPRWLWWLGGILVLAVALMGAAQNLASVARNSGLAEQSARSGITSKAAPEVGRDWVRIIKVEPGSGADKADVRVGDTVGRNLALRNGMLLPPGSEVPVNVIRDGRPVHLTYVVQPSNKPLTTENFLILVVALGGLTTLSFGMLLLLRGRRNRAAILLGLLLVFGAGSGLMEDTWGPTYAIGRLFDLLGLVAGPWSRYFWVLFCLEVSGLHASKRQRLLVHGIAIGFFIASISVTGWQIAFANWAGLRPIAFYIGSSVTVFNQLAGYAIIAWNYRSNDARTRNRLKIIVLAFFAFLLSMLIGVGGATGLFGNATESVITAVIVARAASSGLLAYSVLKQRLFDLGFAVNRTLVYGAVSFTLLAGFGLAEWGVDHFVPEEWHEGSMVISAAIAVGLFLSFHRLRDWLEHHIERVFFRSWHEAEAALTRFVESAGHFDQASPLCEAFGKALSHFAQGAAAALYLREPDGSYRRETGALPGATDQVDQEDPAFALMRAERRPIELRGTHSAFPGTMALPMLDQATLVGFVLIASRPDGLHYRPDEVENMGWAAHQVGLDLQALNARELAAQNARLADRNAWLEQEHERLMGMLASEPRPALG